MQLFLHMNTSILKALLDYDCNSPFIWGYPVFSFLPCYICIQTYFSYCPVRYWNCCFFFLIQFSKILVNSYVWQSEDYSYEILVTQYTIPMIFMDSLGMGYLLYILGLYILLIILVKQYTVSMILMDSLGTGYSLYFLGLYEL